MKIFLWLFVFFPLSSFGQEGGSSVHGGSGVVCRNSNGSISSVEITDLFRARYQPGQKLHLLPSETPEEMLLQNARQELYRANPNFALRVEKMIDEVRSMLVFMPWTKNLDVVQDMGGLPPMEENCSIEQLGAYHDGMIIVDPSYYAKLLPIDRAAFLLHEAIYTIERSFIHSGTINSRKTQYLVGLLLSVDPTTPQVRNAIEALSSYFSFGSGIYQTATIEESQGCQFLLYFRDENGSEVSLFPQVDERQPDGHCPYVGQRKVLVLDARTGSYYERGMTDLEPESGWLIRFYAEGRIVLSENPTEKGSTFIRKGTH